MYDDHKGSDDDIFHTSGNGASLGGNGDTNAADREEGLGAAGADNGGVRGTATERDRANMTDLTKEDLNEFNEQPLNDDDQGSLKGSDDEHNGDNVDFNENTGFDDPQLCKGMRFCNYRCFQESITRMGF